MSRERRKPRRGASVTTQPAPRRAAEVATPGGPRRPTLISSDPDSKLIILMSRVDTEGPWCLTNITREHHLDLLGKIKQWETMTVREIFDQGKEPGKDYAVDNLCSAAQDRLRELKFDDWDRISRLRPTGERRLYGFRDGQRFYVIWWDPHHEICPSRLKHT